MDLPKNMKIVEVHISTIKNGDTIIFTDSKLTTVGNKNIKNGFCGITLFGDSYRSGTVKVKKIEFEAVKAEIEPKIQSINERLEELKNY